MKNKKLRNRIIIISISIVIAIIGISAIMLFSKNKASAKFLANYSLIDELRTLQSKGGTLELTEGKINTTIKSVLDKPIELNSQLTIKDSYATIKDSKITLYTKLNYKNIELQPSITAEVKLRDEFVILELSSIRLGKLPVPKSFILNKLKGYESEDLRIKGNSIEISKYLLPFTTNNIYIKEDKIFIDISKLPILGSELSGAYVAAKQGAGSNPSNTSTNSNSSQGTTSNNTSNIGKGTTTNTQAKPTELPKPVASSMEKISSQMGGVIASVETSEEKSMMAKIQRVVNAVKENPNYPYRAEANEVKAWYSKLDGEAKARVKNAILNNVNVMDILKLINIFGV